MPWVLVTNSDPQRVYCGPDTGWVEVSPPPPPTPEDQAMKFADEKAANDYAQKHGMSAKAVDMPTP